MQTATELNSLLQECIHCGLCLPSCPTYRVNGQEAESPRGRLMLMESAINGGSLDTIPKQHLSQCLGCYTCETVCPSGVNYGELLHQTKGKLGLKNRSLKISILLTLIKSRMLLGLASKVTYFFQSIGIFNLVPQLKAIPRLRLKGFLGNSAEFYSAVGECNGTVAFFSGCVMDNMYPHVHEATIRILRWNGFDVHIPKDQGCCGALHHHSGFDDHSKEMQKALMVIFEEYDYILVNSAGCGAELKTYPEKFSHKIKDVNEFLSSFPLKVPNNPEEVSVIYDAPCHLIHAQKINSEPLSLLQKFNVEILYFDQSQLCCGAAGSYVLEHPHLANDILKQKMEDIGRVANEGTIVTSNPGCHFQLQQGVNQFPNGRFTVKHIVEILDEQYQNMPEYRESL